MKQLARRYVWFPGIDRQIENVHATGAICQASANLPKQEFSPWPEPSGPWERLHLDFAGPYFNRMWLIVVDAYSKFPYTIELAAATTMTAIAALQRIFSVEGLPITIVTDNGTQFTSREFKEFCERNVIKHLTTAPFHPASNGLAERGVRTFKEAFTKIMRDEQHIVLRQIQFQANRHQNCCMVVNRESFWQHYFQVTTKRWKLSLNLQWGEIYLLVTTPDLNGGYAEIFTNLWATKVLIQTSNGAIKLHQNQMRPDKHDYLNDSIDPEDIEIDTNALDSKRELDTTGKRSSLTDVPAPSACNEDIGLRRSQRTRKPTVRFDI
ncbi:PREDICTED: uncharacterized protein LOC108377121 [Rhagoletis zephyria]|uniref:uncharacterized protein LOC108377121 n=1 Tax=Rhagoletis zephyria TaxID=28612 RepID=UPI0008113B7C|nr:PREDICTED: uncharacterized protein LOC108377121 [Rhagoletis zephyria]